MEDDTHFLGVYHTIGQLVRRGITMEERTVENQPLLYIYQGETYKVIANMQSEYFTYSDSIEGEKEEEKVIEMNDKVIEPNKEKSDKKEEMLENKEVVLEHRDETVQPTQKEDRIMPILNLLDHLPRLTCEIKTTTETYRGIISSYEEDLIHFQDVETKEKKSLPLSVINQIKVISF